MIRNIFNKIKFQIIRLIEKNPRVNLYIYNRIHNFKFLFPHEKDYLALKLIFKKFDKNKIFFDIGANIGLSVIGFREMGFKKNKIFAFEPQIEIFKNHLIKLKKKDKNLIVFNFGLSNYSEEKILYTPYIKNTPIHYLCSFDKKYLNNRLKLTYKKYFYNFEIKKSKFILKKFDEIKFKHSPDFIKIDTEGCDHLVLKGMKNLIKIKKPIFLIEYNTENFKEIMKILKHYSCFKYDVSNNKLIRLNRKEVEYYKNLKNIQFDLNYSRNFYFLPK